MKVLLISLVYEPDVVSTAGITAGLARGLRDRGHDVAVLTSVPHFNPDASQWKRARRPWHIDDEDGIRVVRCHIPRKPAQVWRRLGGFATFHLLVCAAAIRHFRDRDATIVISPPLTLAFAGLITRRAGSGRLLYNAQELWPDVPRDLGVVRNERVLRLLDLLERWIYRKSDCVVAIGPQFELAVRERGARDARTIPNFVDTAWIRPTEKDNPLARAWDVASRPVVLYAGNIGLTQDFDALVQLAEALPHAQVLIVGSGAARPQVERALRSTRACNVRLLPYQDADRVSELYGLADVVIVPLKPGHDRTTLPSKVFSAMAAGRPLVVAAASDTDLALTVRDAKAGLVVPPGDTSALIEAVRTLLDEHATIATWDREAALAVAQRHSSTAIAAQYEQVLEDVVTREARC